MLLRVSGGAGLAQPKLSIASIFSIDDFLNSPYSEEPLDFDGQSKEITNHELGLVQVERISSFDKFLNTLSSEGLLEFDDQNKEMTKNELSMQQDQSSGVNHQVQFIVDAESNTSNTLNSGYRGYNNGQDLVLSDMTSQVVLNMESLYNQNFEVLDEEFGITYAPSARTQDNVLQSQSFVENYGELAFDASILDIGSERCTPEDCPELPTYSHSNMENDKREETSTSTKQNLVADSLLTNESPGVLSKTERRRLYNRESARRSREKRQTRVNELEATEELFNEVKPFLCNILIADTGNFMYKAILLWKQLKDLVVKNQNAAIAFGVPASPGFNRASEVAGSKMRRSRSMVRVASCERLHKRRQSGKQQSSQN